MRATAIKNGSIELVDLAPEVIAALNALAPPNYPYPKRLATPKIVGDVAGAALAAVALTAARQIFVPLSVPRAVTLIGLRISVTAAVAGAASIGIYDNAQVAGEDSPGALLVSAPGLNTGTVGNKTGAVGFTLQANTLYWASLIASGAATLRACAVGSVQASLGRAVSGTGVITHLYAAGSGSTLPATAAATLTAATAVLPAIYLVEG